MNGRHISQRTWCLSMAAYLEAAGSLGAQPAANRAADEKAVRQAGKDYLAALQRGDAKALAQFWTAEGTYTDETGRTINVRDWLSNSPEQRVARPQPAVANAVVRFIANDVALEEGDCHLTSADSSTPVPGRFTALWVRQDGRWRLESLRESRHQSADEEDHLAALEVFAGEWTGKLNQSTVRLSARWNATKTFLRREFSVATGGKPSFSGTQHIGWDGQAKQIRSWVFNDDGSHGEGRWSLEGSAWLVASSLFRPDGTTSASTQIYKFRDRDTLVWKSIGGDAAGEPLPDLEVVLQRAAAQ